MIRRLLCTLGLHRPWPLNTRRHDVKGNVYFDRRCRVCGQNVGIVDSLSTFVVDDTEETL